MVTLAAPPPLICTQVSKKYNFLLVSGSMVNLTCASHKLRWSVKLSNSYCCSLVKVSSTYCGTRSLVAKEMLTMLHAQKAPYKG